MKRFIKSADVLIIVVFFVGAALLLYPAFSNVWNQYRNNLLMAEYVTGVDGFRQMNVSRY